MNDDGYRFPLYLDSASGHAGFLSADEKTK
jgi:hypothetical protein